jgi:cytoskeletal protein CcmA (bactofilin family)
MKVTTNTLTFASLFLACARAENLRVGGRDLVELWEKMESINNELRDKISGLEREVNELQEHRQMTEACDFTLRPTDGVCQLTQPLEIQAGLTVAGNSSFVENVDVAGKTSLTTTSIDGGLAVTGSTELDALNINSTLNVIGAVYFADILDVATGLNVTGAINTTDLTVLDTATVSGDSKFQGNVTIEAVVPDDKKKANSDKKKETVVMPTLTLTVGGNFEIAGDAIIAGQTTLQDDVTIAYAPPPAVEESKTKNKGPAITDVVELLGYPSLFVAGGITAAETVTFAKSLEVEYGKMSGLSIASGCEGCNAALTLSLSAYTEAPTSAPDKDAKKGKAL